MDRNETLAIAVGNDWKKVQQRLMSAKSVLARWIAPHFSTFKMIEQDKAMLSGDGKFVLVWRVREHPSQPISYENQQTSAGSVLAFEVRV